MIKKIGSAISGAISKLRGRALKVAVTAVLTVGCMLVGTTLPEPTKNAIVSGAVVVIEAVLSTENMQGDTIHDGNN